MLSWCTFCGSTLMYDNDVFITFLRMTCGALLIRLRVFITTDGSITDTDSLGSFFESS